MKIFKKILVILFALFLLVGCDFSTKRIAQKELKGEPTQFHLGGFVLLTYAENEGGMLSFGNEFPEIVRIIIFQVFVAIMLFLVFLLIIFKKNIKTVNRVAYLLFLSGGIGNLIDRIIYDGKVIDFVVLRIFDFHTGIFNLADLYITLGILLIILSKLISKKKTDELTVAS